MSVVPEMISVVEMISVEGKVLSLVLCEAMAGEIMPRKPSKVAATEVATAETAATPEVASVEATEMATATSKVATATPKAAATTVATASSTMCERGGGRERQNAGQNQAGKRTLN
jgi:hypothetical protein